MCVVALAVGAHPDWQLVLAGNRDEFHARPTAPLDRWRQGAGGDHHIIGGRDLQSGGSWLGISERGRLAVVTNIRGDILPDPQKASRGRLVADFLRDEGDYAAVAEAQLRDFNGVHLMTVQGRGARYATNRPAPAMRNLSTGIYALANEKQEAQCSRRERVNAQLSAWIADDARDCDALFALLRQEARPGESGRPNFLVGEEYGTRCSTVVAIDRSGQGRICERRFGPSGSAAGETEFSFGWPPFFA